MSGTSESGTSEDAVETDGIWAQSARITFRFLFAAVGVIALFWVCSNIRQVPPDSWAVVTRFGAVVRQQGAGLLIAWPRPIEQVLMLPSADRQIELRIARFDATPDGSASSQPSPRPMAAGNVSPGNVSMRNESPRPESPRAELPRPESPRPASQLNTSDTQGDQIPGFDMSENPRLNAGFLLTGDASVVHLQATLFYQISDPAAYVIAADHVRPALERLFVASAVSLCAGRDLDTILVARPELTRNAGAAFSSGRELFRTDLLNAVNKRLEALAAQHAGLGITVSRVDVVPSIPASAKHEFDRVLVVTQAAEQNVAEARTEAELTMQVANQHTDKILADATAAETEQVNAAAARTATIAALARQAPTAGRAAFISQIYFNRVGVLLSKMGSVEAVDPVGQSHVILSGPGTK
jgi:regulator of protease activity HflC (stomatin/prohibitin superfamily)